MTSSRFSPGTFNPAPQRVSMGRMLWVQGRMESLLVLRHGEQVLLSIIIPVAILIGATRLAARTGEHSAAAADGQVLFAMVLAVAATSAGFTGQAISLAFDRRYGALERAGASGVPSWAIIGGKIISVAVMVIVQVAILSAVALLLGIRFPASGLLVALGVLALGVIAMSALGLALGGSLPAEIVLAVANLVWFVLLGAVGWSAYTDQLFQPGAEIFIPTVAMAHSLVTALAGQLPLTGLAVLALWAAAASIFARKVFRFSA